MLAEDADGYAAERRNPRRLRQALYQAVKVAVASPKIGVDDPAQLVSCL
jgi:hypothetical protein